MAYVGPVITKLDRIENASFQQDGLVRSINRGAFWSNLDYTQPAASILQQCATAPGMPVLAPGTSLAATYPNDTSLVYTRLFITATSGTTAKGYLTYMTPTGFPPTVYLIEDSSQLMSYQTNKYPGTNYPIQIKAYSDPGRNPTTGEVNPPVNTQLGPLYTPGATTIPADTVTMTFRLRIRQVRVTRLVYGELYADSTDPAGSAGFPPANGPSITIVSSPLGNLTASTGDGQGQVNDATWWGKPKGHWLCDEFVTRASPYQGTVLIVASAIARSNANWSNFDWSETGILYNTITNKYVNVQNTAAQSGNNGRSIDEVMALPYAFGQIGPNTGGFVRVGPYTTTPFSAIFGF